MVAAKGAPEVIAELCHLNAARRARLMESVDAMAADGPRVLGVARASFAGPTLPAGQHDFAFELVGLVGLADRLRPTAAAAVRECRSAGIKMVMITGDCPATCIGDLAPSRVGDTTHHDRRGPSPNERGSADHAALPRYRARIDRHEKAASQ
jgi:Ca2+-transporting ATPase